MTTAAPTWLETEYGARAAEPLARHSQYGIGGPADWYVAVDDTARLPALLARLHAESVPVTLIGAGSNTLILDGGVRGLVLEIKDKSLVQLDDTTVELAAGCMMPRAALDCA